MALTDAVPSDSLDVLKRNAADLDKALNSTSSFQNRVGNTLLPVPAALAQLPNAVSQALSSIQSDVNTVESEKSSAVSAMQADVDTVESNKTSSLNAMQADVNAVDTRRDSAIDEIVDDIAATHAQKGLAFSEINQDRALVRDKRSEAITDINGYVDEVEARKNQAILTDIPAKVAELGLNYPPIEYASGLTLSDYTQTYVYNNVIYTWGGALGTVTTGAFDEGSWNLVQQVFGGNMFYDAREHISDYTGATPQYQELQEAIDAAVLNGFSRLYLGDGTILLTELDSSAGGVEIPSQITEVFGSGMGATVLKWTDSNASGAGRRDAIKVVNGYSGELLNLNNFTLHGPREAVINTFDGNPSFGVNATGGGTRLIVEKVEAKYCRNQAISASDWDEVEYSSNRLWYNGRGGLCTRQCRRFNAHHNVIVANGDDSIFALQSDNVPNDQSSHAINISDNIIIQSQGIRLLSVKSANVCDNIIEKPLGFGVFAGSIFGDYVEGNCASVGLNISGNLITDCLDRGQLDAFNGANQYIMIESTTPAAQTNGVVPGRSDTITGDVQEPQPWFWTTVDNDSDPAYGNAGTWFTTLENNTLLSTLDTSLSWGEQGGLPFWGNDGVVSNIDVTEELLQCEGVQLSGYVNRLKITGGRIAVRNKQGILFSDVNEDFAIMDSVISNVGIERSVDYPAIDTSFSATDKNIDLVIRDCTIDVDPWHEAGARNADGSWISGSVTSTAIDANRALGVKVVSNTFKNCYQAVRGPVSTFVALNIAVCQPVALGYNAANKGMGVIPTTGGYTHEVVNADPTSADFRKVLTLPLSDSAAKPTGGTYVQGAFVKNSQPTPTNPVLGWLRLTTGSAHVNGVDWQEVIAGGDFKGSTTDLINANADFSEGDVVTTTGFYAAGDACGAQWKATSTTGLTPSQAPADRGAAELVDGSGRLWVLVVNGSAVNVAVFGVDESDIGVAANVAMDWVRAQINSPLAQAPARVEFPQGEYECVTTINMTGIERRGWHIDMSGCLIIGKTTGKPVIDALGSRFGNFYGINVYGDETNRPSIGMQIGLTDGSSADVHYFERPVFTGYYSLASFLNNGSETCTFVAPYFTNKDDGMGSYCLIQDGRNNFGVSSEYVDVTWPSNSPTSFNENTFYSLDARKDSGGPAIYMMRTARHKFFNSYAVSTNDAVFVLDTDSIAHKELHLNVHCETSNAAFDGLSECIRITGIANPVFKGFYFEDHAPHAKGQIIKADSGVSPIFIESEIRLSGFNTIPANGIFSPVGQFEYNGCIYTDDPSVVKNIAKLNGSLTVDDINAVTFGPGTVEITDTSTGVKSVKGKVVYYDRETGNIPAGDLGAQGSVSIQGRGGIKLRGSACKIDFSGEQLSTTASSGTVALPANAKGYISISIDGVTHRIPYYAP